MHEFGTFVFEGLQGMSCPSNKWRKKNYYSYRGGRGGSGRGRGFRGRGRFYY